jgi:proteic killer suppression protein
MEVEFADQTLKQIDEEPDFRGSYAAELVRAFRKVIRFVRSASDERDFRAMRSLNFEKLKGTDEQYSMRLNKQWRLIVEIKPSDPKNIIVVICIADYHD